MEKQERLREEIISLNQEISSLLDQNKDLSESLSKSQQNNIIANQLRDQLADTLTRIEYLEKDNVFLQQTIQQEKDELNKAHFTVRNIKDTYDQSTSLERWTIEKQLHVSQMKNADLQKLLEITSQALQEKSVEVDLTRKLLLETEKKVMKYESKESEKSLSPEQYETLKNSLKDEQYNKSKQQIEQLVEENSQLKSIVQQLQELIKEYQESTTLLNDQEIETLRKELDHYILKLKEKEESVTRQNAEIEKLQNQNSELEQEKEKIKKEKDTIYDRLKRAQQISNDLETQLDATEQELQVQLDLNQENKEECDKLKSSYQEQSLRAQQEIHELSDELKSLMKVLERERKDNESLKTQRTKLIETLEAENFTLKSKISEMKSVFNEQKATDELGILLSSTKDQLIEQCNLLLKIIIYISLVQNELEQLAAKFEETETEKNDITSKLNYLEVQVEDANQQIALCTCRNTEPKRNETILSVLDNISELDSMLKHLLNDQSKEILESLANRLISIETKLKKM